MQNCYITYGNTWIGRPQKNRREGSPSILLLNLTPFQLFFIWFQISLKSVKTFIKIYWLSVLWAMVSQNSFEWVLNDTQL